MGQLLLLCQGLGVPVWAKFALDLGFRVVLITGKELRAKLPTRYSLLFPIFPYFSPLFPVIPHYSLFFLDVPHYSLMFPIFPVFLCYSPIFPVIPHYSLMFSDVPSPVTP